MLVEDEYIEVLSSESEEEESEEEEKADEFPGNNCKNSPGQECVKMTLLAAQIRIKHFEIDVEDLE